MRPIFGRPARYSRGQRLLSGYRLEFHPITRRASHAGEARTPRSGRRALSVELRGIEPLTFSMRKTGTAVDRGCFRTS